MGAVLGFAILIVIVLLVAAFGMWATTGIGARLGRKMPVDPASRAAAPLSGDTVMTHHPSPDGRFDVVTAAIEMRNSHWVEVPSLVDLQHNREIFALDDLWSADVITWSPDSRTATLKLRKFPSDVPGVTLTIDLLTGEAQFIARSGIERVPAEAVEQWLADYVKRFGVPSVSPVV